MEDVKSRFLTKTKALPDGCVIWTAAQDAAGYGRFWMLKRMLPASQAAYRLFVGDIPEGLVVRHKCSRKDCVNVSHLILGTQAENMIDLALSGKSPNQKADFAEARRRREQGATLASIAKTFDCSVQAIYQGLVRNYGTANFNK